MLKQIQICRKIHWLGCVNQARTRARVTQPSPHIFLRICTYPYLSIKYHDKIVVVRYDHDEVCGNANFLFLYMKSSIAYISLCTKIG